jgi:polyhydroxyalkanoate synthesis regulator phasin
MVCKSRLQKAEAAKETATSLHRAHYDTGDLLDEKARAHVNDVLARAQVEVDGAVGAIEWLESKIAATKQRISEAKDKVEREEAATKSSATVETYAIAATNLERSITDALDAH